MAPERDGKSSRPVAATRRRTFRTVLILGFAAAGVLHIVAAGRSTSVTEIPLTAQLGLIQLLPAGYWLGLGLTGFATVLAWRERSDPLLVATGALLLAVFAGAPSFVEPNPRYWDAYLHFSGAQAIQAAGHLPADNIGQYSANWPGSFLLVSMVSQVTGIPATVLLATYPLLAGGLTFLAIYVFLRSKFPQTVAGPGAVLASFGAVWAQYHLSPQALGFVLLLLVLAIVWRRGIRMRALSAILFVGLVVSHPTSTLILLAILIVLSLLGLVRRPQSPDAKEQARLVRRVTAAYATTWFAWLYFHATSSSQVAQTAILTRMGALISLPESTLSLASSRTVENLFTWAPRLRLGSLAVFGLLGLVGLVLLRRDRNSRFVSSFVASTFVALGLIAAADILGFGGQFYDRSLLLFAVIAPALCLAGLRALPNRWIRVGVAAVLVSACAGAASTAYYQEAFNLVTDESLAVSDFLERAQPGSQVVDGFYPQPVWIDPAHQVPLVRDSFQRTYPVPLGVLGTYATTYAVFDRTAQLWYLQWRGADIYRSYEEDAEDFSRIYDNGRGSIYFVGV